MLKAILRLSVASLIISSQVTAAQQTRPAILRGDDLRKDAAVLRQAFEALHPGLYRYNSKGRTDREFTVLEQQLSKDQTQQDAYLTLSTFAAKIKCGHTYPNFFNQSKKVAAELFQNSRRLPFYFRWVDRQMVVIRDLTGTNQLSPGTTIRQINGVPTSAILSKLMAVARADGSNDAKRISYMEVIGDSQYEAFDIYYPMFFKPLGEKVSLLVQRPNEASSVIKMPTLTYEQRIAPIKETEEGRKGGDRVLFSWSYLDNGAALLRMPTWALYDSKWEWKKWLNERLDEAVQRKAPALIIDLRGNEGGQDVGDEILKRLVTSDLSLNTSLRLVRYRAVPPELVPYLDTWDPSFKNWGSSTHELTEHIPNLPPVPYMRLSKFDDESASQVIRPEGAHFSGKVFVLVDASNSSATFQFAQVVQQNKLGTLVGTPTGGNQRGINGGAFFFLRLPNSGLELDLPLIGFFPKAALPDRGLTPDIVVKTTAADIASSRDREIEAVRRLLH